MKASLKPLEHRDTIVSRGLRGALIRVPIIPRGVIFFSFWFRCCRKYPINPIPIPDRELPIPIIGTLSTITYRAYVGYICGYRILVPNQPLRIGPMSATYVAVTGKFLLRKFHLGKFHRENSSYGKFLLWKIPPMENSTYGKFHL